MNHLLVLVHPGSACRSADFNIGKQDADAARDALISELNNWTGGVLVIDGHLNDELAGHPDLNIAIDSVLERAKLKGLPSEREYGDDGMEGGPTQEERAQEFARNLPDHGMGFKFTVTGAWFHPDDNGGCVGSVMDALREIGCDVHLGIGAVHLPFEDGPHEKLEKPSSLMRP